MRISTAMPWFVWIAPQQLLLLLLLLLLCLRRYMVPAVSSLHHAPL